VAFQVVDPLASGGDLPRRSFQAGRDPVLFRVFSGPPAKALNLQRSRLSEKACRSWRIFSSSPLPCQSSGSVLRPMSPSSLAGL
jgi:hypothetical protein